MDEKLFLFWVGSGLIYLSFYYTVFKKMSFMDISVGLTFGPILLFKWIFDLSRYYTKQKYKGPK